MMAVCGLYDWLWCCAQHCKDSWLSVEDGRVIFYGRDYFWPRGEEWPNVYAKGKVALFA